jgi:DNA-binding NtrC family response regulator
VQRSETILLLEDEMLIAIDVGDSLQSAGFTKLKSFNRCDRAIAYLAHSTPNAALVDLHLQDGISREVVGILHQRSIPFVVYSGMPCVPEEHGEIYLEGQWLQKPATPEQLVEAMERCLANNQPTPAG